MLQHAPLDDLQICVLAAGKGKRMCSSLPKVLHPLLGRAMVDYVLRTVEKLQPKGIALVTGHASELVQAHVGNPANLSWVIQDQQLGTGHAVRQCEAAIRDVRDVLIVCGDTPLLQSDTLRQLVARHRSSGAGITVLTAEVSNPFGYGRIVRAEDGSIAQIVEERDADATQKKICEVCSGIYCVRFDTLFTLLHQIENRNAQQEYYLPDIVPIGLQHGVKIDSDTMRDADDMLGINNRIQLAEAERIMQQRIIHDWQLQGVTIEQPESVRIEHGVRIGNDTTLCAGCQLTGNTAIGDNCEIGSYSIIHDGWIDDGVRILPYCHIESASIGNGASIGPFARLRPEAKLDSDVHVGNFVEIKKSVVGHGSKINHLTYIGDSVIGEACNIGAGTITCNYDGANKHQTTIGDHVFIGSDTKLIAPITVGDNATVGAGSIITKDIRKGGLTLSARPEQRHLPHWQRPSKPHQE
ncbi:MAG: bifunctional UDP-N-acetylglucosamine diphosphorylase/glucosamine-1-phosphate N-acetyltransferase GlmU [Mariprofundales bacterium]|nr:bifunctional UDP-N-acetylglucosamine diphosphorylase/glucosamine-1-phosphate N-acetyltransferase GlmU [Mariprofundales bacterium]